MKAVTVIGAGNIGSRHLQALKAVAEPMRIEVVDPDPASLQTARERYEQAPGSTAHRVEFLSAPPPRGSVYDIAIVSTSSGPRKAAIEELLTRADVRCFVLEKLLFTQPEAYASIPALLRQRGASAWVNCCMRQIPAYQRMRETFRGRRLSYFVSGSRALFGLVTNALHYVDHIAHLTGCSSFTVSTESLDTEALPSKRKGYLELTGTMTVTFSDGSFGAFTCFPDGSAPYVVEIHSGRDRYVGRETEHLSFVSRESDAWRWAESEATIPYQSILSVDLVRSLFERGICELTPLEESIELHRMLLEPLREFLGRKQGEALSEYPFT